jgi:hypothetical protein
VAKRLLPDAIAEQVLAFPEFRMGVHRVAVTLQSGEGFSGVLVSWGHEVVRVEGHDGVPFEAAEVASVADDSGG